MSNDLYDEAGYINTNWLSRVRTVSLMDTTMPDDHNVQNDVINGYFGSIGITVPVTLRQIAENPDKIISSDFYILATDINDIVTSAKELMTQIVALFGSPYTVDYDWPYLVSLLDSFTSIKYGDYVSSFGWNTVADWIRRFTALILRYSPVYATWLQFHKDQLRHGRGEALNVIHFGDNYHKIYAVNPDGTLKWTYTTGGTVRSSAAILTDGTLYIGCSDHYLYCLYPNGTLKWRHGLSYAIVKAPAVDSNGNIYISDTSVYLYSIDKDGNENWGNGFAAGSPSDCTIDSSDLIYFSCGITKKVFCIYPNMSVKWSITLPSAVYTSPAVASDGTCYVGCNNTWIYALDVNGGIKWIYDTEGGFPGGSFSPPAIGPDGTIYIGGYRSGFPSNEAYSMIALHPDGTLRWRYFTGGIIACCPAITTSSPTLKEYYDTGDDDFWNVNGVNFEAQTFIALSSYTIKSVRLLLYRLGNPGTFTVSIRATVAGVPTGLGTDLCSGTTNGDTLPTGAPYEWREISFGAGYALTAGVTYAIVIEPSSMTALVKWREDSSDPTYAGGSDFWSNDSGGTWHVRLNHDNMFKTFTAPDTMYSTPGTVYFTCYDGYLYALDSSGSLKWKWKPEGAPTYNLVSSPAIAPDGTIIVGWFDYYLYCLNPDGTVKWTYEAEAGIYSSPSMI